MNHPQDKSLETVEAMVPKFYRNAKDIYKKNASNKDVTQTNKNPNKKKLSDKVRKYLVTTMLKTVFGSLFTTLETKLVLFG